MKVSLLYARGIYAPILCARMCIVPAHRVCPCQSNQGQAKTCQAQPGALGSIV